MQQILLGFFNRHNNVSNNMLWRSDNVDYVLIMMMMMLQFHRSESDINIDEKNKKYVNRNTASLKYIGNHVFLK